MMKRGAVVMLDVLGFKGITRRPGVTSESVIAALKELRRSALAEKVARREEFRRKLDKRIGVQVATLSDTIVIAVPVAGLKSDVPKRGDGSDGALFCAGAIASAVIAAAARSTPPLALRGVVTFGQFYLEKWIIVGPAIDEAASLERAAEGAIVWLAPSAVATLRAHKHEVHDLGFARYKVPMKGGGAYETGTVNPFQWTKRYGEDDREDLRRHLLSGFASSRDVSVQIKQQNTAEFLEVALEARLRG